VFAYTSTETKVNIQYSFAVIHDNNMATKPKLRTLAEERLPMLSSPAGIATWKKEMSLLATQISPDLGRLFDGTARIDCLPKPPQTTDTFPEACGGGLRYPSGATSRKYTDAVEQYLEKMDNFAKEEKQLFAKMLSLIDTKGGCRRQVEQHPSFAQAKCGDDCITLLLHCIDAALTGVTQVDRLSRLTLITRSRQAASFDEWAEALQEAHTQLRHDWKDGDAANIPIDRLLTSVLLSGSGNEFAPLVAQLTQEPVRKSSQEPAPNGRILDGTFEDVLVHFKEYLATKTSLAKAKTASGTPSTRKAPPPEPDRCRPPGDGRTHTLPSVRLHPWRENRPSTQQVHSPQPPEGTTTHQISNQQGTTQPPQ
jgi:hypothetical protein